MNAKFHVKRESMRLEMASVVAHWRDRMLHISSETIYDVTMVALGIGVACLASNLAAFYSLENDWEGEGGITNLTM